MNHKFFAAALLLLCLPLLFAGCQSSAGSASELSSIEEDSNWADLNPEESPTPTPSPSADIVMPELSQAEENEKDITADYLGTFVGIWNNEGQTAVWTFSENGKLTVETTGDQKVQNWSWSVVEVSGGSRLKLVSDSEDRQYSFTVDNSSTITLYNPSTGNASEVLTRVKEEDQPVESTEPSQEPSAAPTAAPTAEASAAPAEQSAAPSASQSPEAAPTAAATTEEEQPEQQERQEQQEQQEQPEGQNEQEASENSSEVIIEEIKSSANYPAVESVLDTLALGYGFNSSDSQSFWTTVASYLCKNLGASDDGYLYVTESQVRNAGIEIYGSLDSIPDCGGVSGIVSATTENGADYRVLWGQSGGTDTEYISYEGNEIVVTVNGTTYKVVTTPSGAVDSVEAVS